jgi:glycosyltransferase involved in cell wall biosynthesis
MEEFAVRTVSSETATFVMPHYNDHPDMTGYVERALDGLRAQTDPDWQLIIVDDASARRRNREHLQRLAGDDPGRIFVLQRDRNQGQGVCRNIGVRWAADHGSRIILFHDADDVSHPRRLELTRSVFSSRPDVGFLYSTFTVIDENDEEVEPSRLTYSVAEILESHRTPVEGRNAWIRIGTETGYTSLTSTVAVRTPLAVAHPFPAVRGSEDGHTWLRMSTGTSFCFLPSIPGRYRIPQRTRGSSDRSRIGGDYYRRKAVVDSDGFMRAATTAASAGSIDPTSIPDLHALFLRRLAKTLAGEGQDQVAAEVLELIGTVTHAG